MESVPDPIDTALQFVRAEKSKREYRLCISRFLRWGGLSSSAFVERAATTPKWAESLIINYVQSSAKRGLSGATIALHVASLKTLFDYNDVVGVNWRKVRKAMPPTRTFGKDRAPTLEEVRSILKFCDARSRAIILFLASGGFRAGAFDFFTLSDYTLIRDDAGKVLAGRLVVYRGEPEEYVTFVTPEAVAALQEYLDFRSRSGEAIGPSSPIFRDAWDVEVGGSVSQVKRLSTRGVSGVIARATLRAGLKERDFKMVHGFRKFFKTRCEMAMKSIYVEVLMGHSLGISSSYMKPTEKELLSEYLKAVPYLTIAEAEELKRELSRKDEELSRMNQKLLDIIYRVGRLEERVS